MRWRDFAGFKLFGLITLYHITQHHITSQPCGISRGAFTPKKTEKERKRETETEIDAEIERDIEEERQREG